MTEEPCLDELFEGYGVRDDFLLYISFWMTCVYVFSGTLLQFFRGVRHGRDITRILFTGSTQLRWCCFAIALMLVAIYINFWPKWRDHDHSVSPSSTLVVVVWMLANIWGCFSVFWLSLSIHRGFILFFLSFAFYFWSLMIVLLEKLMNWNLDVGMVLPVFGFLMAGVLTFKMFPIFLITVESLKQYSDQLKIDFTTYSTVVDHTDLIDEIDKQLPTKTNDTQTQSKSN